MIEVNASSQAAASEAVGLALADLERAAAELDTTIAQVDADLCPELLRRAGRSRAAAAVTRATRWRGAGMAASLPEPEFSELVLFPTANQVVERIVPTYGAGTPTASALQVVRCLADRPVTICSTTPDSLSVELAAPVASGVKAAWEALAQVHSGAHVQLNSAGSKETAGT